MEFITKFEFFTLLYGTGFNFRIVKLFMPLNKVMRGIFIINLYQTHA